MALVFGDSFDHYQSADIMKKWTTTPTGTVGTNINIVAYGLAPHDTCLQLANGVAVEKTLPSALDTFVSGFWFRTNTLTTARLIFAGMDSATPANIHVSVRYDTSGHLTFCRDATVLATSTNTISVDTWYHMEVKATIGDSPSGAYEVRVDGTATNWIPATSSVDTRNSGNASIGSVRLSGGANSGAPLGHMFQDFYILNTTGSVANNFVGPSRFQVIRPVGAGTTAEWTGNYADNWQNVGEGSADSDSTFNQSSTAGQTDQFTMTDVPSGTVHAVQHVIMARRDAGGARTVRPVTRISSTDYTGTSQTAAATYVFLTEAVSVSPATSSAWTDSEINAAEFGYELVS